MDILDVKEERRALEIQLWHCSSEYGPSLSIQHMLAPSVILYATLLCEGFCKAGLAGMCGQLGNYPEMIELLLTSA